MESASDKKPLIASSSSRGSDESDSRKEKGLPTGSGSQSGSFKAGAGEASARTEKAHPAADGGPRQTRIVRPTAQARPYSTRTKGVYWIFTILHLIALLCVLFALSSGLLAFVFHQTEDGPLYWGEGSFIGGVPAIMHEPAVPLGENAEGEDEKNTRLLKFNPNATSTFQKYVERLKEVTKPAGSSALPGDRCEARRGRWTGEGEEYCALDPLNSLPRVGEDTDYVCDPATSPHMGYDVGTPCLLIRLTKLRGFFPMADSQVHSQERPNATQSTCAESVTFKCTATSSNSTSVPLLMPAGGLPFCAFPFWSQKGYTPPYIMMRPAQPLPDGETKIECAPALLHLKKLSNEGDNTLSLRLLIQRE